MNRAKAVGTTSATAGPGRIRTSFVNDDNDRQAGLNIVRMCTSLTVPALLPPLGQTADSVLPENYQSDGALGMANMSGKMMLSLYPPDSPWYELTLTPEILYDDSVPDQTKIVLERELFLKELQIAATLESADLVLSTNRRSGGFRTSKRSAIQYVLATGDCLEYIGPDYRIRTYRRDKYVTGRDSCGDVLYHTTVDSVDPLSLTHKQQEESKLEIEELKGEPVRDRMCELYTHVEWQPWTKTWVITQEVNGHEVNKTEEKISPYFSTFFDLVEGENYGRGYVERNLGDLRSLDNLELRRLDLLAAASKILWVRDYASQVRASDMRKPSGSIIDGRVVGGLVQDVGMLHADNIREFSMMTEGIRDKRRGIAKAFLLESEVQPKGDRVTRYQVQRVAMELEGILGGVYAPIAEMQQLPLLRRVIYQLVRDKLMQPFAKGTVNVKALTGLSAVSRASKAADVVDLTAAVQGLGPQAMRRINEGVLIDVLARYKSINVPGLIKTDEQIKAEDQQAIANQAQVDANAAAAQAAGSVVTNASNAALQRGAA